MLRQLAVLALSSSLAACAGRGQVLPDRLAAGAEAPAVELVDTPFFPQADYQCGPAALATVLQSAGVDVPPGELTDKVFLPARQGSLQMELLAATRRFGRLPHVLAPDLDNLIDELDAGRPVLVLQNLGFRFAPAWHYAVVVGYLPAADRLVLRSGTEQRLVVTAESFLRTWESAGSWALVVLRPGELPVRPEPTTYLETVAALESSGQWQAARAAYAAATERWPDDPMARLGLGNAEYGLGRPRRAEAVFRDLVARQPEHAIARNNLAHVLAERGCHDAAMRHVDAALAADGVDAAVRDRLLQTRREIGEARRRTALSRVHDGCTAQ